MKKIFSLATAAMILLLSSCQPEDKQEKVVCIDFDEVALPEPGYQHQMPYVKNDLPLSFGHSYTFYEEWGYDSWTGFVLSNQTDTETPGYVNQYSVASGAAASGENFLVFFRDSYDASHNEIAFTDASEHLFKSMALCNATYAYLSMKNGDDFSKKFEDGDWFKLTISAYDVNNVEIGAMDVYLADFRDGRKELLNTWKTVDLTALGKANKLSFEFSSSDNGVWGMNTPAYVCIDNIVYVEN